MYEQYPGSLEMTIPGFSATAAPNPCGPDGSMIRNIQN